MVVLSWFSLLRWWIWSLRFYLPLLLTSSLSFDTPCLYSTIPDLPSRSSLLEILLLCHLRNAGNTWMQVSKPLHAMLPPHGVGTNVHDAADSRIHRNIFLKLLELPWKLLELKETRKTTMNLPMSTSFTFASLTCKPLSSWHPGSLRVTLGGPPPWLHIRIPWGPLNTPCIQAMLRAGEVSVHVSVFFRLWMFPVCSWTWNPLS